MPTAHLDAPAPSRDVLTRDEAAGRAARVGAIAYDLALALTADGDDLPWRGPPGLRGPRHGRPVPRLPGRDHRASRGQWHRGGPAGSSGCPDRPARRAPGAGHARAGGLRERLRPQRRRVPPLRRSGRRRGLHLLELRAVRGAPALSVLRSARPQGNPRDPRDGAGELGRRVQQPGRARRRGVRRAAHAPLRHHATHLHLPCRGHRGPLRGRSCRAPRDPARGLEPAVRGAVRRRGRDLRDHAAGDGLLHGPLLAAVPVREVRPALRARVQCRGDGERRRRHVHGAARLPGPAHRDPAPGAGGDDPPRAGPHVVRRPGHDALVGRPLAQRELRDLRLARARCRMPPVSRAPGVRSMPT